MSEQHESTGAGLMVGLLVAAGTIMGAGLYTLTNRCSTCRKFFVSPKPCYVCRKRVCPACACERQLDDEFGEKGKYWLCNEGCEAELRADIHERVRDEALRAKWEALGQRVDTGEVNHFSVNYAHNKQVPKYNKRLESQWYEYQCDALRELKILALQYDSECKTVWFVDYGKPELTKIEGTLTGKKSLWQATGLI